MPISAYCHLVLDNNFSFCHLTAHHFYSKVGLMFYCTDCQMQMFTTMEEREFLSISNCSFCSETFLGLKITVLLQQTSYLEKLKSDSLCYDPFKMLNLVQSISFCYTDGNNKTCPDETRTCLVQKKKPQTCVVCVGLQLHSQFNSSGVDRAAQAI